MIASSKVAQQIRRAGEFGVHSDGLRVDLAEIVDREDQIVESIRNGSYRAVDQNGDLDLIEGHGRFTSAHWLQVDGRTIEADRVFLNIGTRDLIPPIDGLDRVPYLTSRTILELRELPEHLIVVGGGFIGVEFAQMFRRHGARVTLVQRAGRLVPAEDPAIAEVIAETFTDEGIDLLLSTPFSQRRPRTMPPPSPP